MLHSFYKLSKDSWDHYTRMLLHMLESVENTLSKYNDNSATGRRVNFCMQDAYSMPCLNKTLECKSEGD
jgi:hypothetical protein